ncbi:MAG: hypothetical protein ACI89X_001243 [Planctomycetota bacterium]
MSIDARDDRIPDIVKDAERAWVVGVPHSLVFLMCGSGWWLLRRQRRTSTGRKPIVSEV